jgi:CheY-like chemotaxis protein
VLFLDRRTATVRASSLRLGPRCGASGSGLQTGTAGASPGTLRARIGYAMAKKRILFIDNRPEHLKQPALRLQVEGYDVHEADSGANGLERLRTEPFDLLIIDAELPNEDGWDVLKEVRDDPRFDGLKAIVFMAGKGETGRLMLVPVDAELRRPFSMKALIDAVQRVIGEP